jgi:HSP20 family protein
VLGRIVFSFLNTRGVITMNLSSLIPVGRNRETARRDDMPFLSLQREIDRLFDDFSRGFPLLGRRGSSDGQALMPAMDVTETETDIEIAAELPGLEEKDVQINLADDVLTIRGEKKSERDEKNKDYCLIERSYGSFYRALELPAGVDPDKIKASIAKGVLKVVVPKPAPAQVKKIPVKAAA